MFIVCAFALKTARTSTIKISVLVSWPGFLDDNHCKDITVEFIDKEV
jgi:hypothetical protein